MKLKTVLSLLKWEGKFFFLRNVIIKTTIKWLQYIIWEIHERHGEAAIGL